MKLRQFREVVAVAEQGSIRAAARHLQIAQPALTRSLIELERELGAALFERRARGVVPTAIGQAFVQRAAQILQAVRRTGEEVEQLRGAVTGTVTAGLSIAAHLALLPGTLKPFRLRYPQAKLHIIEGFYPTLELGLRTGAIDFYLGVDPGQRLPAELTREVLFENRRIILGRAGHPLAAERTLSGLSDAEWATTSIMLEDEDEIGLVFAQHGLPCPKLVLRAQSALTLMTCLLQSDLLAMVPVQWNEFPLTRGSLMEIQVREELAAPPMVVIQRSDLPLTPVATYLLDLLRRARSAPSCRDRISRA